MVFSSYVFVFVFLPVTVAGYFLLSKHRDGRWQRVFLILASLVFYGWFNPSYLLIITGSILGNYAVSGLLTRGRGAFKKPLLLAGVLFNLGLLGYFKYTDFFIGNLNALFQTDLALRNIVLPLGISFFTFQQFSFLIAVYQGKSRSEGFLDYCLFVLFFPQLVAGPIVLYEEMMPQFLDQKRRYIDWDNMARGVYLFVIGLFLKAVLADSAALIVDNGFSSDSLGLLPAWCTMLAYTTQIYFDFCGYATMSMGLGLMFNIDIPLNFNRPNRAISISDFWRRWHLTLGRALSTYVYFPLGGSRRGMARTCLNLFVTFLISGIWHGASWTFVVWGMCHGALVVTERLFRTKLERIPSPIRYAGTFLTVGTLRVLFRAESFRQAATVWRGMVNFRDIGLEAVSALGVDGLIGFPAGVRAGYVLLLVAGLVWFAIASRSARERLARFSFSRAQIAGTTLLFVLSVIHLARESVFIYFNF